jgi:hypothetical protein
MGQFMQRQSKLDLLNFRGQYLIISQVQLVSSLISQDISDLGFDFPMVAKGDGERLKLRYQLQRPPMDLG